MLVSQAQAVVVAEEDLEVTGEEEEALAVDGVGVEVEVEVENATSSAITGAANLDQIAGSLMATVATVAGEV